MGDCSFDTSGTASAWSWAPPRWRSCATRETTCLPRRPGRAAARCASRPGRGRGAPGPHGPVDRDLPGGLGRRRLRRLGSGAARDPGACAGRSAPSTWTSKPGRRSATPCLRRTDGDRVVLSTHDFAGVPGDLADASSARCARRPPRSSRVAVHAHRLRDCAAAARAWHGSSPAGDASCIAMGDAGAVTRILAAPIRVALDLRRRRLGTRADLASSALRDEFRFRSVTPATALYGVVGRAGRRIRVSPAMHNAAFAPRGIDAVYVPLAAADADDFLAFADGARRSRRERDDSVQGGARCRTRRSTTTGDAQSARINTLRRRDGAMGRRRTPTSTGFLAPLRDRGVALAAARGGARRGRRRARRWRWRCAMPGARVTVHARRSRSAPRRSPRLRADVAPCVPPPPGTLGSAGQRDAGRHASGHRRVAAARRPVRRRAGLRPRLQPAETRLLREAARPAATTIGGLDMLVAQAQDQFEWWTGTAARGRRHATAAARRVCGVPGRMAPS